MNILRVIASMNPAHGGPSQGIRNSIPALKRKGIYNEVLSFDAPDAPFLGNDPFPLHAIGPGRGPYAYCQRLGTWLHENLERFDVVIVHGLWLHNTYGTYRVWSQYKRKHPNHTPKLYVMPHGMLDPYFQRAKHRRWKALRNRIFWELFERKAVNNADGILFTCEEELRLARESFAGYQPQQELNVGYGIQDPATFSPQKMQEAFYRVCTDLPYQEPYLLFLSRIHPKKGLDILVETYHRLWKQHRSLQTLVIAGPGLDSDFGREIRQMAADCPQIKFTGMLIGDAKWGALYGCQAFVLPSHQENYGIAIVEAMACGKPVLISNQVNIWREIEAGGGGWAERDDVAGMEHLLTRWHALDETARQQMAHNARATFETLFTVDKAADRLVQTFKAI